MALGETAIKRHRLVFGAVVCLLATVALADNVRCQDQVARVGVLAFRGTQAAEARWQPLIRYLNAAVRDWRFELVPVTLITAPQRLETNALDFIITNPGHYVTLAERFQLSALATRERRHLRQATGLLHYGTAIVVRADQPDIETLADLTGQTLAAVSPEAFGGFQMAWYEFDRQGIDPFSALKTIRYMGFPQDEIVADVLAGKADAGVVRSGLVEALAHEGRLDLSKVKVLMTNAQTEYPFLISSRLYPEWPFAARPGTDRRLTEAVTRALLATQDAANAVEHALPDLWSAPLSYEGVRAVISAYRTRLAAADAAARDPGIGRGFWIAIAIVSGLAGLLLGFLGWRFGSRPSPDAPAAATVTHTVSDQERARFDALTRREREVLQLICRGEPTKRIAEALHISPKTVEYHRANLLQKTEAGSTPRLVQMATKLGFDQAAVQA